ncbi:sensor histidine kinase [Peribacillus aracenensis]|uniref:sensor histidine kinase n=1 Tax=Peribacillus aracenensis TaxID=2976708 RepID=UPI0021A814EF|nr:HAMP domain-containing sensor histidine kinase [Peribacillus sp. BBB004]
MSNSLIGKAVWGMALIFLGISMPHWLSSQNVGLGILMNIMEENPHGNTLLILAFSIVMLNTIRALPFYIGAIMLGNALGEKLQRNWLRIAIPLAVIPLTYAIINLSIKSNYHFGIPAIIILLCIILVQLLEKGRLGLFMKSLILVQILFGVQWLDEVPFLTRYGFGHGAISTNVKKWAIEIGFDQALSLYAIVLCSIFLINAFILMGFLVRWRIIQELHIIKLEALEARSDKEVLNLVHDLKTPLASIEGLISLIGLYNKHERTKEYCGSISLSISSMSEMISEILYKSHKSCCSLKNLVDYTLSSRLSGTDKKVNLELPDQPETIKIWVNKIRMTRAIVNLINNAFDAIEGCPEGKVTIKAKTYGNQILLGVSDNGKGMNEEEQKKIWKAGYSTKYQSGIGLSFVHQVVEEHKGTVSIESKIGQGTTIWMHLAGGNNDEDFSY